MSKINWKHGLIFEILAWLDCGFNVITGGNHEVMVSQRVGRFQIESPTPYWNFLGSVIDFTFEPVDGPNHCVNAYLNNLDEDYNRGSDIALAILAVLVFVGCLFILIPIMYTLIVPILYLINLIKTKKSGKKT